MNTSKLSLQNPDNMNKQRDPKTHATENKIVKNRTESIDIPGWDKIQNKKHEIPTMDFSPIYDESSPEAQMRKKSPQKNIQLQTQSPIRISKHENINDTVSEDKIERGFVRNIYNFFFGGNT
tara:strand:+ start:85 stop:450 length:366 start_codon:yes stop_codon:yes gene_type:complete